MKRSRSLSKKAARNQLCHEAIRDIQAGNCSLPDMSYAVNEVCRRAPKKLQIHLTKVLNKQCGGRLQGLGDPKRIAREAKTVEEYARRVEAWNASEAKPLSITRLVKAWAGGRSPHLTARLIREAREARIEDRERLWSKMGRGLK